MAPATSEPLKPGPRTTWLRATAQWLSAFLLGNAFQCAAQLTVGIIIVSCFVFIKDLQFYQSCLAATLFIECSLLAALDNHVGSKILGCAGVVGTVLWGSVAAGGLLSLAHEIAGPAPSPAHSATICLLGAAGIALLAVNRVGAPPLPFLMLLAGMVSCLGFGLTLILGQFQPSHTLIWKNAVGTVLASACIGAAVTVLVSVAVLPTTAAEEARARLAEAVRGVGEATSRYASLAFKPEGASTHPGAGAGAGGLHRGFKSRPSGLSRFTPGPGGAAGEGEAGPGSASNPQPHTHTHAHAHAHAHPHHVRNASDGSVLGGGVGVGGGGVVDGDPPGVPSSKSTPNLAAMARPSPSSASLPRGASGSLSNYGVYGSMYDDGQDPYGTDSDMDEEPDADDTGAAIGIMLEDGEELSDEAFLELVQQNTRPKLPADLLGPSPGGKPAPAPAAKPSAASAAPPPPVSALRPLLARARTCLNNASVEPPCMLAEPFDIAAWSAVIAAAEELITRVAALESVASGLPGGGQMIRDATFRHLFTVDVVSPFRVTLSHVATACAQLSAALAGRGRHSRSSGGGGGSGWGAGGWGWGGSHGSGSSGFSEAQAQAQAVCWPEVKRELREVVMAAYHGYWGRVRRGHKRRVRIIEAHRIRGFSFLWSLTGGILDSMEGLQRAVAVATHRPHLCPPPEPSNHPKGPGGASPAPAAEAPGLSPARPTEAPSSGPATFPAQAASPTLLGPIAAAAAVAAATSPHGKAAEQPHPHPHPAPVAHPHGPTPLRQSSAPMPHDPAHPLHSSHPHPHPQAQHPHGPHPGPLAASASISLAALDHAADAAAAQHDLDEQMQIQLQLHMQQMRDQISNAPDLDLDKVLSLDHLAQPLARYSQPLAQAASAIAARVGLGPSPGPGEGASAAVRDMSSHGASAAQPTPAGVPDGPGAAPAAPQAAQQAAQQAQHGGAPCGAMLSGSCWGGRDWAWLKRIVLLMLGEFMVAGIVRTLARVAPTLGSRGGWRQLLGSRIFQAGFKYFLAVSTVLVLILGLSEAYPIVRQYRPMFGYIVAVLTMSERVEATLSRVSFWLGGTVVGGTLGFLVMMDSAVAASPVALGAVIAAVTFLIGCTPSIPPLRQTAILTLITFAGVSFCQYKGTCCSHGSPEFYGARVLAVIGGTACAVLLSNVILPWYTSDWALQTMAGVFRAVSVAAAEDYQAFFWEGFSHRRIIRTSAPSGPALAAFSPSAAVPAASPFAAAASCDAKTAAPATEPPPVVSISLSEDPKHPGSRSAIQIHGSHPPAPEGAIAIAIPPSSDPHQPLAAAGNTTGPSPGTSPPLAADDVALSGPGSGTEPAGSGSGSGRSRSASRPPPLIGARSLGRQSVYSVAAAQEPPHAVPSPKALQELVGHPLLTVQVSLVQDTVMWTRGPLVTPPVVPAVLRASQQLADQLAALGLTARPGGVHAGGAFTGWAWEHLLAPIHPELLAYFDSLQAVAAAVGAHLALLAGGGGGGGEGGMEATAAAVEAAVAALNGCRLQVHRGIVALRRAFHTGVLAASEEALPAMTAPDDALRLYAFTFALTQVVDKATALARTVAAFRRPYRRRLIGGCLVPAWCG